jgi:hypothetical protein
MNHDAILRGNGGDISPVSGALPASSKAANMRSSPAPGIANTSKSVRPARVRHGLRDRIQYRKSATALMQPAGTSPH